jgi:hypothetical protein
MYRRRPGSLRPCDEATALPSSATAPTRPGLSPSSSTARAPEVAGVGPAAAPGSPGSWGWRPVAQRSRSRRSVPHRPSARTALPQSAAVQPPPRATNRQFGRRPAPRREPPQSWPGPAWRGDSPSALGAAMQLPTPLPHGPPGRAPTWARRCSRQPALAAAPAAAPAASASASAAAALAPAAANARPRPRGPDEGWALTPRRISLGERGLGRSGRAIKRVC